MTVQTKCFTAFVGCDVGKKNIVIFQSDKKKSQSVANNRAALEAWAAELPADCLVVCEATGGYESGLLAVLVEKGLAAHRADARKVKAFIRSLGTLGKTDAIDAKALARYAEDRQTGLPLWQAREANRDRLQALVLARRDLVVDRAAYVNRMRAPTGGHAASCFEAVIACLDTQIEALEQSADDLIRECNQLHEAAKLLRSIPGIGPVTASALLALMPELGTTTRRQAASLAGLAPHPRQSGAADRYRRVRGGRPEVKQTLYMAALAATRTPGPLQQTYNRLIENGKKPLVALTAIMRKIIVIANARLHGLY